MYIIVMYSLYFYFNYWVQFNGNLFFIYLKSVCNILVMLFSYVVETFHALYFEQT